MQRHSFFHILGLILLVATSITACTPKKIASDITAQIMASGAPSLEQESDLEVGELAGVTLIKMIESLAYDNPKNKTLNLLLARSYANYSQAFLEYSLLTTRNANPADYDKYLKRARLFYKRGKEYGLNVLTARGSFKKALAQPLDDFKKHLQGMGRSDVPALFWTAMNWGSECNLNKDNPLTIAEYPKVEAMMQRVVELNPNYFFGTPHVFMGYSYGARPRMFGGDPQKSLEHFDAAIKASDGKFLLAKVFKAEVYAVQIQDLHLFETVLTEVMSADAAALPDERLGNEMAKKRAAWLLAHKADYFAIAAPVAAGYSGH